MKYTHWDVTVIISAVVGIIVELCSSYISPAEYYSKRQIKSGNV